MSTATPSREAVRTLSGQATLVNLRDHILGANDLPPRRRQDVASALRTLDKALGRGLGETPAHPALLRQRLRGFSPATARISTRRWRNILSLTRFALKHAGLAHVPGRYQETISPEWAEQYRHLRGPEARHGLSRLARYCSVHGIQPGEVSDKVIGKFLDDLENAGLINKPRAVHRNTCVLWNRAAAAIPVWPKVQLTVPDYQNHYVLPWTTFPASLKADFDSYLNHLSNKDILAEDDTPSLKSSSLKTRTIQFRGYMSALVHRGQNPELLRSLADLVAVKTVNEGMRFFLARSGGKPKSRIYDIACAITSAARHWVKVEDAHLAELKAVCRRLKTRHLGMTEKNQSRLRPFDDPVNVRALLGLPEGIIAKLPRTGAPTYSQAREVQTALAIELLLMVPLRIGNLSRIDLDRHIIRSRAKGAVHLAIPAHEVKNGTDIEAVLPTPTGGLLDLYLERYRPLLINEPCSWLFPGRKQRSKNGQSLSLQIVKCVKSRCGLIINPHLFRHIAAKLYLDANPGAYGVVRLMHGHKSVETTTRYYCGAEGPAAMRHFDEHILKLR